MIYKTSVLFYASIILALRTRFVISALHPVILIPGDGGNQLEAKLNKTDAVHYICAKQTTDYFNIWLNMELLVPLVIDCWIDNIKLNYNSSTRTTSSPDGVDIRVPGFGGSETVEWLDPSHAATGAYFNTIADTLVRLGYTRNTTIKGAPYDFRKAPDENKEYFVNLKKLIETTYEENNQTSIMIISHSMGGLMTSYFLSLQSQAWKDKYIQRLIALSGPWGGSVKAIKVYAIGDDLGSYVLRESVMRAEQITSPSLAWLLPSPLFWKPDEVLVQTEKENFTLTSLQAFFTGIAFPDGWEMKKDVDPFKSDFKPPGVEVHCLYGSQVQTVEKLYYKPGTWLDGSPTLMYGDGDGTVNTRSLEGCMHWRTLQKQKVFDRVLPTVDHTAILHSDITQEYITGLVQKDEPRSIAFMKEYRKQTKLSRILHSKKYNKLKEKLGYLPEKLDVNNV